MSGIWQALASITYLAPPLAWLAEHRYRRLEPLPIDCPETALPSLTIIIPARNEAHNLPVLLPTLKTLSYPGPLEILVVDDHSEDETAVVAARFGARVINAPPLPAGWRGKPHACHTGAARATGKWLLFTDADTQHAPHSAAAAVSHCEKVQLPGLTLFLRQKTAGLTDQLALTAAFSGLFAGLQSGTPLLNGQYILLRADIYRQTNGFAAVREEMIEDMALAHHLRRHGHQLPIFRGESAGQVRMYADWQQMWQGLSRLGAGSLKWAGNGGWISAAFITALMSPFIAMLGVLNHKLDWKWLAGTWLTASLSASGWTRRFGRARNTLLVPFGAILVQTASTWGLLTRIFKKKIKWKGRAV